MSLLDAPARWVPVCPVARLTPDRGVAALVDGHAVAVFLLGTGEVYAVDHRDPFSGANVLARGLVGDQDGVPTVASPVYKQRFDLRSGACIDDPSVAVATWPARVAGGVVEVGLR
jgi:nitrite reductase (NADH) small subunit